MNSSNDSSNNNQGAIATFLSICLFCFFIILILGAGFIDSRNRELESLKLENIKLETLRNVCEARRGK